MPLVPYTNLELCLYGLEELASATSKSRTPAVLHSAKVGPAGEAGGEEGGGDHGDEGGAGVPGLPGDGRG